MRKINVLILLVLGFALTAWAGTINSIKIEKGKYLVKYSGNLVCKSFKLDNPDRFVVDIVGVDNCSICDGKSYVSESEGVQIKQCWHKRGNDEISKLYDNNTFRVSFVGIDFKHVSCKNDREHSLLIVSFKKQDSQVYIKKNKHSDNESASLNVIERISLRKFKNYEMIVALLKNKPEYNVRAVGEKLFLTINNSKAVASAMIKQDLSGESQAVNSIEPVKASSNSVRYVITLKKGVKLSRYYADNRHVYLIFPVKSSFVEHVKESSAKPNKEKTAKNRKILNINKPISFDVRDAQLKDIFRVFAQISGLNFIVGNDVKGTLTMKLKDVPLDQALNLILQQEGLVAERHGNVVVIMTAKKYQMEKNQQLKALEEKKRLERLKNSITKVINLNYVTPDYAVSIINKLLYNSQKGVSGFVVSDVKNNAIICHDTPENIKKIERIVRLIDHKKKAIEIDARIVEISKTFERQIGIQWGGTYENYYNTPGTTKTFLAVGNGDNLPSNPFNPDLPKPGNDFVVNLPTALSDAPVAANLGLLIGKADYNIDLKLTAGEIEGYTKIISSPKVITLDNQPAKIESGQQIPYQETAGASGATSVSFKDATLSLEVTPHITNDNQIILKVKVSKNSADFAHAVNGEPPINTNTVQTTVILSNGETLVLGGLVQKTNLKTTSGVPGLMKIPLLGWLFKTKRYYNPENELFIFVTPKIINK